MQINWVFQSKSRHLVEWVKEHNPTICCLQGTYFRNFPGGTVDKNPPANAGNMGSIPGPGRFHMPWSNQARVSQLLKPVLPIACVPLREKPSQ